MESHRRLIGVLACLTACALALACTDRLSEGAACELAKEALRENGVDTHRGALPADPSGECTRFSSKSERGVAEIQVKADVTDSRGTHFLVIQVGLEHTDQGWVVKSRKIKR